MTRPPNVKIVRKPNGREHVYFQTKGAPLIALPDLPFDDPAFLTAYAKAKRQIAERAAPKPAGGKRGSIAAWITTACAERRLRGYSDSYARMLRRELDAVRAIAADAPLRGIRARHVRADVLAASAPGSRLKAWRYLCATAMEAGGLDEDPSITVRLPRDPGRHKAKIGHRRWPRAAIEDFRARHAIGSVSRAGMELLLWTGGRIGDAVEMGRQHVARDGVLDYSQSKTGAPGYVPWTSPLPSWAAVWAPDRDELHAALAALGTGRLTFLETQAGRTRSAKAFGTLIRDAWDAAGWPDLTGHGARKTRACDLIDSGATPHQAAAWTGHEDIKTLAHYARQADRRAMVVGTEQAQNAGNPAAPALETALKAQRKQGLK